jgi:hypothetical protein
VGISVGRPARSRQRYCRCPRWSAPRFLSSELSSTVQSWPSINPEVELQIGRLRVPLCCNYGLPAILSTYSAWPTSRLANNRLDRESLVKTGNPDQYAAIKMAIDYFPDRTSSVLYYQSFCPLNIRQRLSKFKLDEYFFPTLIFSSNFFHFSTCRLTFK